MENFRNEEQLQVYIQLQYVQYGLDDILQPSEYSTNEVQFENLKKILRCGNQYRIGYPLIMV